MIKGILLVKFNEPFQRKDSMNEKDVEVKIVIYKSFLWYFFFSYLCDLGIKYSLLPVKLTQNFRKKYIH